ncbi:MULTISPECIES: hypothetical protein [Bacillus]|uniref:hypothetical protein n=1 Tax=Bacillus TaxID=1386 RepID=UPI0009110440|nr:MULTISPECIES: hypothetical protein [Bacillus]MED3269738.1 hypothetical protein [Bacillus thuringiensis]PFA83807.1 hypothetical protein CN400_16680 [Bacillus thuringiensis]PFB40391.1 hypothetical protein CN396_27220 [Bacillus thuringiensis]PFE91148.1 hypothetical protein CN321_17945 [Bacillus thuringiensis]PFV38503.1 hypothetical protein COL03_28355 [Bacillus thuringiensis]
MKLNTLKLQELNKEENEQVNGGVSPGDLWSIGTTLWEVAKDYGKGKGPAMEMQYKHGMPGGKW